jgi:hypothetical protein
VCRINMAAYVSRRIAIRIIRHVTVRSTEGASAQAAGPADDPVGRPGVRNDRAAWSMRALGRKGLPASFVIDGTMYRLAQTVKHDFWAATGFYASDAGRKVVLKMGRTQEYAGFPLDWAGRWLCRREVRFYQHLADLPNVPAVLGTVGPTGFVHDYVEGRPLCKDRPVPDGFFDRLQALIDELHRRDLAYVDTNKPENILLGADGLPHLIDFQISADLREPLPVPVPLPLPAAVRRAIVRRMQRADLYHLLKHKKRLRRDEMTPDELARAGRRGFLIRLHRFLTRPYFLIRRRTFKRLRDSGQLLPEGSK